MTTFTIILLCIYLLSALIVGPINWGRNHDAKVAGRESLMVDKVMNLYVLPLCPVLNSFVAFGIIINQLDA